MWLEHSFLKHYFQSEHFTIRTMEASQRRQGWHRTMLPLLEGRFQILAGSKFNSPAGLDLNSLSGLWVPSFSGLSLC